MIRRNPKHKDRLGKSSSEGDKKATIRNQLYCPSAYQNKLKFESEKKAETHLKWLKDEDFEEGRKPIRAYYCRSCAGWHVTSSEKRGRK